MNIFDSPDVERVLLASMFTNAEALHQALGLGLKPEHFANKDYRVIIYAIQKLAETGAPVQYETLATAFHGDQHIKDVVEDISSPLHMPRRDVSWHVEEIIDKAKRRAFVAACQKAMSAAQDGSEKTDDCLGYMSDELLQIQSESAGSPVVKMNDLMPNVLVTLRTRTEREGLIGLTTGIPDLDDVTTGIRPGELWIVGALPGRGKTALGAQIALANTRDHIPAGFFSLEMGREELGCRFLANETTVGATKIRNPRLLNTVHWNDLSDCVYKLSDWPLFIDDSSSLQINQLVARARLYIRRFGCKLIVVDYLRLVNGPGPTLRERMGNVADALRRLAKDEKVGVVALSQLSRPQDKDINSRPTMLDLKESGDLEAHAHVVLLIFTPMEKSAPTGEDEIIIGKNRHGSIGSVDVVLHPGQLKFQARAI
jgi:replicative DNA helicase